MIFPLCKWCFDINWHIFEKKWADVFQIYPNAIHLNPLQFCPSMPLLGFPVFCLSSSIVLNRHFHILGDPMIIWSVLKLPKIAWPSPFKHYCNITFKLVLNIVSRSPADNGMMESRNHSEVFKKRLFILTVYNKPVNCQHLAIFISTCCKPKSISLHCLRTEDSFSLSFHIVHRLVIILLITLIATSHVVELVKSEIKIESTL